MNSYPPREFWMVVYQLVECKTNKKGIAFVEARSRNMAIRAFTEQYKGQFSSVECCKKLIKTKI